jgi:hypothetical protein
MIRLALLLTFAVGACGPGIAGGPTMSNKIGGGAPKDLDGAQSVVVSADILAREPLANTAMVKHILISWADLSDTFQGRQDPRAAKRSKTDAENEIKSLLGQIKAGGDFDKIMKESSEDKGSAMSGAPFKVTPDAGLVIEFRQLSLRLKLDEVGVCQSDFGFHIIKRYQ